MAASHPFDETRIQLAIEAAFKADAGLHPDQTLAARRTKQRHACHQRRMSPPPSVPPPPANGGTTLEIEFIQDLVETQLMEAGHHSIARRYILYREERRKARALRGDRTVDGAPQTQLFVSLPDQPARTARSTAHPSAAHQRVPQPRAKLLGARPRRRSVKKSLRRREAGRNRAGDDFCRAGAD